MSQAVELGLDTFGDVTVGADGQPITQAQALRDVVSEGVLADAVGLDSFGVGEHHRPDFAVSAPEVVLAAIATGVAKRTSCQPLAVSPLKVADASIVPVAVHNLPVCGPTLLEPL